MCAALGAVNLTDTRYSATADHYWSAVNFSASLMTSNGLPIAGVPDLGTNRSASGKVLLGNGSALPYPIIWNSDVTGVTIAPDPLMGAAAVFATSSCVQFANLSSLSRTVYDACLIDPSQCQFGISAAVWVKFSFSALNASTTPVALLSTGPVTGFYLFQMGAVTYVTVTTSNGSYSASGTSRYVQPDKWVCIGFTWSTTYGAHIFVNNYDLNANGGQSSIQPTATSSATATPYFSIGCYTNGLFSGPISIAHVAIWYYRLRSESREEVLLNGALLVNVLRYQTTTTSAVATVAPSFVSRLFDFSSTVELAFPSTVGTFRSELSIFCKCHIKS